MMHTMEIVFPITDEELFRDVEERLNLDVSRGVYKNTYYSPNGFREIRLIHYTLHTGLTYRAIEILLNPKLLLNPELLIQSTTVTEIPLITEPFDRELRTIFGNLSGVLPTFNHWNCKRIDYCVDVSTENVSEYIQLFHHSRTPNRHYTLHNEYDSSAYSTSRSLILNFYDKENETESRLENEHTTIRIEHLEEARNILRIEVQCRSSKINYIRRRAGFPNKHIEHFLSEQLAESILLTYFDRSIGLGDFYSLSYARRRVRQLVRQKRTQDNLIGMLRLVKDAGSVNSAKEQFMLTASKEVFNRRVKALRKLGINPVTIPSGWAMNQLPNPRQSLLDYFHPL
ncbi:hypothetical protein P40081_15005 [Paenibacillus sp. FSL P4-0081]|jgi:hypothetical protein|uniref:hypothetical protein n=1 Tax=unclassified Paenibacillus TaxID=185978 RepID=UPI0004F7DAF7|nr:hypothetical protein [Paenibacillus sp. FSL P4-0081]AIQ29314.1 hypothetical protein P40081_15005 [Paenibacillus sp. FSL P4-0081]